MNPLHEDFLYEYFKLPEATDDKSRTEFSLFDITLVNADGKKVSLLELDPFVSPSFAGLELSGWAMPFHVQGEEKDSLNDNDPDEPYQHEYTGLREVLLVASDFIRIVPSFLPRPVVFLETKRARYRLTSPSTEYVDAFEETTLFLNYYVFGREKHILGQNNKPVQELVDAMQLALGLPESCPSQQLLDPPYHLSRTLSNYPLRDNHRIAGLLYRHLINTPLYASPSLLPLDEASELT